MAIDPTVRVVVIRNAIADLKYALRYRDEMFTCNILVRSQRTHDPMYEFHGFRHTTDIRCEYEAFSIKRRYPSAFVRFLRGVFNYNMHPKWWNGPAYAYYPERLANLHAFLAYAETQAPRE